MTLKYSDFEKNALGWLRLSREYLQSAETLCNLQNNKVLETRSHPPIDMLCAHGAELALKGAVTFLYRGQANLKDQYGHNLIKLWDSVFLNPKGKAVLLNGEKVMRSDWKRVLRAANDQTRNTLQEYGLNTETNLSEFGVLNNSDIGTSLPKLREAVSWLNDRHLIDGSRFRYPWTGIDNRIILRVGNHEEDMVHRTIYSGFSKVCNDIVALIHQTRNAP